MERRHLLGQPAAAGRVFTQHRLERSGIWAEAVSLAAPVSYDATAQRESLVMLVETLVFDAVRWRHERGRDDKGNKGQDS